MLYARQYWSNQQGLPAYFIFTTSAVDVGFERESLKVLIACNRLLRVDWCVEGSDGKPSTLVEAASSSSRKSQRYLPRTIKHSLRPQDGRLVTSGLPAIVV